MAKTKLMAILNATPDSFHESSRALHLDEAIARAIRFQNEGADILDIGGESTRPNADPVEEKEELARVIPVIEALKGQLKIPISIDTMKPGVARAAIKAGASLINDVSGFSDPEMVKIAAEYGLDICAMHMEGTPRTMQVNPSYPNGITTHLVKWFQSKIQSLTEAGIKKEKIILDPGIGFGKTVADNLEIIHNLWRFKELGQPVLLGISRKSFLRKILDKDTHEMLPATLTINAIAIHAGVDIIRVHDVLEHRDAIDVLHAYMLNKGL